MEGGSCQRRCQDSTCQHWQVSLRDQVSEILAFCEITTLFSSNFLGSHRYPEPWGESMREVVALKDDASSSLWAINFYKLPDMGQDTHYAKAHSLVHIYSQRRSYPPRLKRSSIKEEHRISRFQLLRFVEENYPYIVYIQSMTLFFVIDRGQ